jgi:hypothetical protein
MVETPRDFARRLLLRSHRALCTPSGSGSPDRSSYPSRLPSAYLPQNTRFKQNLPDRANTRRFVRAPVHDPRYLTDLRAFPGPKCSERKPLGENGKKIKEFFYKSQQLAMIRGSAQCFGDRQYKKEKNPRSDTQGRKRVLDCETERESTTVLCTGIDPRWLAEKGARRRPIWMKKVDDNERTIPQNRTHLQTSSPSPLQSMIAVDDRMRVW